MSALRKCKAVLVALAASYTSMVFFNNITDYLTNLSYIQHVMSVDSLPNDSPHIWRSIQIPLLHHLAYLLIIIFQLLSAALCWKGFLQMFKVHDSEYFLSGKLTSTIGLTMAFGIWFGGFFVIGGEWFLAWQTPWGALASTSRVLTTVGITLVFINLPEDY